MIECTGKAGLPAETPPLRAAPMRDVLPAHDAPIPESSANTIVSRRQPYTIRRVNIPRRFTRQT